MQHAAATFQSENAPIYYQVWRPDTAPIGSIVAVHGWGDHSGILVCPALRAHVPWWQKLGARVISAVRPTQVLYNVPNNPAYQADPMAARMIGTARLLAEMLGAMARTRAGLGKVRLPLHIIAGRHDPVVHVPEVNELLRLVGATDKQLKVYEATAHNPFDQADAPRVLADLLGWLQSRRK